MTLSPCRHACYNAQPLPASEFRFKMTVVMGILTIAAAIYLQVRRRCSPAFPITYVLTTFPFL